MPDRIHAELCARGYESDLAYTHPFQGGNLFWCKEDRRRTTTWTRSVQLDQGGHRPDFISIIMHLLINDIAWRTNLDSLVERASVIRSQRRTLAEQKARHRRTFATLLYAQKHLHSNGIHTLNHPGPFDVLKYHSVDALVNRRLAYDPTGRYEDVTLNDVGDAELHQAVDAAYSAVADWHEERRRFLAGSLLNDEQRASQDGAPLLDLAFVFWKCKVCQSDSDTSKHSHWMSTAQLLGHRCHQRMISDSSPPLCSEWGAQDVFDNHEETDVNRNPSSPRTGELDLPVFLLDAEAVPAPLPPRWHGGARYWSYKIQRHAIKSALNILDALGLDRRTTTSSDMEDVRLIHKNCMYATGTYLTWDQAVSGSWCQMILAVGNSMCSCRSAILSLIHAWNGRKTRHRPDGRNCDGIL
jgi:hypothetical protein